MNDCLHKSHQVLRESSNPSPFEVVATFTAFFVDARPVRTPLPKMVFGDLADKQNAVSAFFLSVDFLQETELRTKDGIASSRGAFDGHGNGWGQTGSPISPSRVILDDHRSVMIIVEVRKEMYPRTAS